jgi:hypothetical protein
MLEWSICGTGSITGTIEQPVHIMNAQMI